MTVDNGSLEIKEGSILFTPPEEGGKNPLILPVQGLNIFLNGKPIECPTEVKAGDELKLEEIEEDAEKAVISFQIAKDNLSAAIRVKKGLKVRYKLQDTPVSFTLKPIVEQVFSGVPPAEAAEIESLLEKNRINYGINRETLEKALQNMNGEWIEIARGLPPVPGKDARINVFFQENIGWTSREEDLEKVDFRDRGQVLSVEENTLLAEKIPPTKGTEGIAVTGAKIPAKPGKDLRLKAGINTVPDDKGLKIFAAKTGRPVVHENTGGYKLELLPVFTVNGDVDINSGHIRFQGDIIINGKVLESMEVTSGGDIKILGQVNGANLQATGSVSVLNNVINSKIVTGAGRAFALRAVPFLQELEETLVQILKAYQQLKKTSQFEKSRFGFILELLAEKKFSRLVPLLKKLPSFLEVNFKGELSPEVLNYIYIVKDNILAFQPLPYLELKAALELLENTRTLRELLLEQPGRGSDIFVQYSLNSHLEASGKVTVAGQGCFHTQIIAQEDVEINGVVRGGVIEAKKVVRINKIGSEAAILTKVVVPQEGLIYLEKVYENTLVEIGKQSYKFNIPRSRVKVCFDREQHNLALSTY